LSLTKYNKTKDPASVNAITIVRNFSVSIHPMVHGKVDEDEEALMNFRESIKNYKPKQSVLEIGIAKT
jgi:hypothetical protein